MYPHRQRPALCMAIVASVFASAGDAAAEPALRVRGGCELQLAARRSTDGEGALHASGTLLDDLGDPLAGRRVALSFEGTGTTAVTDAQGNFDAVLGASTWTTALVARWDGDALHLGCDGEAQASSGRQPVSLHWGLPAGTVVDLAEPQHEFEVLASSEPGAEHLRLELSMDGGQPIAQARTDAVGRARFTVAAALLGSARVARLRARTPGDATRLPAEATLAITVRATPRLRLDATPAEGGQAVTVSGRLALPAEPLGARAITLLDGAGGVLGTFPTDPLGAFHATVPVPISGRRPDGSAALIAHFRSDAPWLRDARSQEVLVALARPRSPSLAWLLVPLVLCLWLLRRARLAATPSARTDGEAPPGPGREPGIALGTAGPRRRPPTTAVGGRVFDADSGDALPGTRVTLSTENASPQLAVTDGKGRYHFPDGPAGTLTLEASADGYAPERTSLRLPHRGPYLNMRIGLRSLRNVAFDHFRGVGDRLGGRPGASIQQTPRELEAAAAARDALPPGAAALARRVEAAVYGQSPPSPDEVSAIGKEAVRVGPAGPAETSAAEDGGGRRATIPHRR